MSRSIPWWAFGRWVCLGVTCTVYVRRCNDYDDDDDDFRGVDPALELCVVVLNV